MTAKDAAKILGVIPNQVKALCRYGRLRGAKQRGRWIIDDDSVAELAEYRRAQVSQGLQRPGRKRAQRGEAN